MITILEKPIPFGGGIALTPNKERSLKHGLKQLSLPDIIKIPVRQHIGSPARPLVTPGEYVLKGQLLADAQGYISAPVHASTSGTVVEIAEHILPSPSGEKSTCIVIETDGKEIGLDDKIIIDDYYNINPIEIQQKVLASGIVGLGGAGFPSAVKLIPGLNLDIELLILNAAECEPYISCDETLIHHRIKDVITGLEILAHALQVDDCVIAIEENKTEAIEILQQALQEYATIEISLRQISSLYPAGGEKQIIKSVTGLDVPADGLPVDIGVVCYNVGTALAVKKAILDSEPLISRVVTVTGPGINQPCNLEVLIGTPINHVIEACGGYNDCFEYLIMGGPMMGFRLHSDDVPVIKTTNCLLAAGLELSASGMTESPCIRCDDCVPVCPVSLQPQQLHWHSKEFNPERLQDYRLFDCIECGCCSYVCPSRIPLVDNYRQAKSHIWSNRRRQLEAEQNRRRYENKLTRIENRKLERTKTKQKRSMGLSANEQTEKKQAEIAAAVARVKEKRKLKNQK